MISEQLQNLHKIGLLDAVPFSAELLEKMLNVAQTRLQRHCNVWCIHWI